MFSDRATEFTPEQTNLVEIIAGRVSAELQREALLTECVSSKQVDRQLVRAAQWQQDHHPNVMPLLDDWRLVGWTSESPMLNSGFFDWFVPSDGSLAITLGHGDGPMIQSALTAATVHSSIRSHAQHVQDARELIRQVNETLWNGSAGGNLASAFFGKIVPETGVLEFCSAGEVGALLVGEKGVTSLADPSLPLASEPDNSYRLRTVQLEPGDHLVLFKPTVIQPGGEDEKIMDAQMLAAALNGRAALETGEAGDGNLLDAVCAAIDDLAPAADHAVLIVRRCGDGQSGHNDR
jgi:serine phosphatase RsbU (regulator of sigma subunit)